MLPLEEVGDCSNPVECAMGGLVPVINGISQVAGFFSDPWGNSFKVFRDSAKSLATDVLPQLSKATMPDLSVDWFLRAYAVSFALAIILAIFLLLADLIRTARGKLAGSELFDSIAQYFPLFIVGATFGPMMGYFIVSMVHALSDSVAVWGITGSIDGTIDGLQKMIDEVDPLGIAGGVLVAAGLMLCMVIGLILVVLIHIVLLVTLYFLGALIPLGVVWIIRSTKRNFGKILLTIWVGVLAAHPLLYFMLGVAFFLISGSVIAFDSIGFRTLVGLITAVVAMFMAALSPMLLLKFAPVIPGATGMSAADFSMPSGSWGSGNVHETVNRESSRSETSSTDSSESESVSTSSSTSSVESTAYDDAVASRTTSSAPVSVGEGSGSPADASAASAAAETTAGGAAGGASAAEAGMATGAAESSTGVGAAIGIPTMVAAATVGAAASGMQKAVDYSVAPMDEEEGQQ